MLSLNVDLPSSGSQVSTMSKQKTTVKSVGEKGTDFIDMDQKNLSQDIIPHTVAVET
jgi:D-alanine-D-alanine ligase-like ATP-grasp enzyme